MLDFFKTLPNWAKGILFLSFSIIVAALIMSKDTSSNDPPGQPGHPSKTETKYKQVSLTVKNPQKEPLDHVKVEFNFTGAPPSKFTDSNGYVQINIPERNDIKIYLSKKGYKTRDYILNLLADPDSNKEIELEQEPESVLPVPETPNTVLETPPGKKIVTDEPVPLWKIKTPYKVNDIVEFEGKKYKCIQAHTSDSFDWTPSNVPALWEHIIASLLGGIVENDG
ncbi:carbohydrate-binding protein [Trichormus variabilis]|uniref:Chitin-binding type-3 domain-containing protein n=1 Tax=Trichormus variabilis SAG 1403-4b TaxID=447716 RepID=A0A433UMF8_ANAVA|nr:carbohydrate-binding protein [Trichormus variabilis]MBD2625038.1 hypothetical protein [Trichormus variabilis FACHB-164]RUS95028.1 hypothetical protein DSM107003_32280 [Trichormus variabilis SAG 1403-4b]